MSHKTNEIEASRYQRRIDDLLDEVARLTALLRACNELDGVEVLATAEAMRVAVAANAECNAKLLTLARFTDACRKTGYRPFPWELEIIIDPRNPSLGFTRTD